MKVYTLLKQLDDPVKPLLIYDKGGTFLYRGVVNNVPRHIAKSEVKTQWESDNNVTWIRLK